VSKRWHRACYGSLTSVHEIPFMDIPPTPRSLLTGIIHVKRLGIHKTACLSSLSFLHNLQSFNAGHIPLSEQCFETLSTLTKLRKLTIGFDGVFLDMSISVFDLIVSFPSNLTSLTILGS